MLGGSKTLADYRFAIDLTYKSVRSDQTLPSYNTTDFLDFIVRFARYKNLSPL